MAQVQAVEHSEREHGRTLDLGIVSSVKETHLFHYQSIVGKLNSGRQPGRVATVFDVVRDMREEGPARFDLLNVFERSIDPQVRRMFFETQTVEHKHVETLQGVNGFRRYLAEIGRVRKVVEAISHHG